MYYRLNASAEIDNPDQRIAEDINTFTQKIPPVPARAGQRAVLQSAAYSGRPVGDLPGSLVLFLIVYAVVGTTVTVRLFGRALVGLNFNKARREADFRFSLVRIREHAEAIAFAAGEARESRQAGPALRRGTANASRLIGARFSGSTCFQYAYSFMTIACPARSLSGGSCPGGRQWAGPSRRRGAFAAILGGAGGDLSTTSSFRSFAAGIDRLDSFAGSLDREARRHQRRAHRVQRGFADPHRRADPWTPNRERT